MAKLQTHNAIVTRNTDEDLGIELRGAVFFEAPSLFDGEYPLPAKPCFPFASSIGGGMFFVPKVGDEIEVVIAVDDPKNPHNTNDVELPEPRWICMIYSDVAEIFSEFQVNYPFRMGWVSNSGHQLIFDDAEGKELVRLAHTVGSFIEMDRTGDMQQEVQRDLIANIFGKKTQSIQKDKIEDIGGSHTKTIKKDKNETINGDYNLNVKGAYNFQLDGNQSYEMNELAQILGSLTQTIRGQRTVKVDGGNKTVIGGADSRAVLANDNQTISGKQNVLVAQEHEATYGLGSLETIVTLNKKFEILLGNFIVEVVAGNIDFSTIAGIVNFGNALAALAVDVTGGIEIANALGGFAVDPIGNAEISGTTVVVNGGAGPVLTQLLNPVVDNITGAPHVGVLTFLA